MLRTLVGLMGAIIGFVMTIVVCVVIGATIAWLVNTNGQRPPTGPLMNIFIAFIIGLAAGMARAGYIYAQRLVTRRGTSPGSAF